MQPFILILFLGTIAFANEQALLPYELIGWPLAAAIIIPKLLWSALYGLACRHTARTLSEPGVHRRLRRLDRIGAIYRVGILVLYFHDLGAGALWRLQGLIGQHAVLVNELVMMVPPMAMLIWGWWCYYPIDRRLRDAQLIRRLDEGLPVHPVWTRRQYLIAQLRFQVALLFVPLVALLGISQIIELYVPAGMAPFRPLLQLCAAGCIFLFAPVVIRHMWDTTPLPGGEVRDRLTAMCRQHRVGVRELLVWQTFGGMVNAAVMGLVRPLRYILLSDGLLEMLSQRQVEAVMAHELAHVRCKHIVWLLAAAMALMSTLAIAGTALAESVSPTLADGKADYAGVAASIILWFAGFGWVSRRFERQADTFAVQHLADQQPTIDTMSAATMIQALEQVARLNHIDPRKRSWRHGSIAWRQHYLQQLIGRPNGVMPIDRQVMWIKIASVIALAGAAAVTITAQRW